KTMPRTTIFCIVGAASISAFPLFSGFVSKSMVMSAAIEEGYDWVWLMLLFSAAGVFHHAGIKIPYFAFFAHDSGIRVSDPPINMQLAMFVAAALCITIGVFPSLLYSLLPYDTGYNPYDATHILAQTQLLFFSALAFVWLNLRNMYPPELRSTNLDFDWFYRRLCPNILKGVFARIAALGDLNRAFVSRLAALSPTLARQFGPEGALASSHPVASMVKWVIVLLAVYLILSFI
ncbi:MAG: Na(+)/H(+) antiporter subunit D, partial [Gammaproteobacteria bacterium]|nr:Na(+)/H(+) antiporter subunit D [Gammaproteobacteria bacterium]